MLTTVESLFADEPAQAPSPAPFVPPAPPAAEAAELPVFLPAPAPPSPRARQGAGVGVLLAVAGTSVGYLFGGLRGAGAGLLLTGAARNTLRASRGWTDPDPTVRHEAGTSASLALFGTLVGGYLVYTVRAGTDE